MHRKDYVLPLAECAAAPTNPVGGKAALPTRMRYVMFCLAASR
jgi:hypothetical protein